MTDLDPMAAPIVVLVLEGAVGACAPGLAPQVLVPSRVSSPRRIVPIDPSVLLFQGELLEARVGCRGRRLHVASLTDSARRRTDEAKARPGRETKP